MRVGVNGNTKRVSATYTRWWETMSTWLLTDAAAAYPATVPIGGNGVGGSGP